MEKGLHMYYNFIEECTYVALPHPDTLTQLVHIDVVPAGISKSLPHYKQACGKIAWEA